MKITSYQLKKVNPRTNNHTFYMVEFRDPRTGNPTRRRGYTGKREAKHEAISLIAKLRETNIYANHKLTFNQVAKRWLDNKKSLVSGYTYCKYTSQYKNHLIGAFGNKKMVEITIEDCQKLVYQLSDKYKRWDKIVSTFSSVFRYAIKYDIVSLNPFDRVDRPKIQHDNNPNSFTADQFATFKRAIKERYEKDNPKAFTVLWLLSHTGLRKGEALGLKWDDVDLKKGFIHIKRAVTRDYDDHLIEGDKPKNRYSIRQVPIGKETIQILKKWRVEQCGQLHCLNKKSSTYNGLVFTSQKGGILATSKPGKWLNVITRNYNLPHITVHGLRHTYATLLAMNDLSPAKIAKELGHKDSTITTKIYIDLHDSKSHEASSILEKY